MPFELSVLDWIANNTHTAFGDKFLPFISSLCNHGELWIGFALLLILIPKTRRTGLTVLFALGLVMTFVSILKPIVHRARPFAFSEAVQLLIKAPKDWSFPSGHTASSFAAVFALVFRKSRLWIPALAVALTIAFSRLYLYVHFPTDVLAGVLMGLAAGFAMERIMRAIFRRYDEKRLNRKAG